MGMSARIRELPHGPGREACAPGKERGAKGPPRRSESVLGRALDRKADDRDSCLPSRPLSKRDHTWETEEKGEGEMRPRCEGEENNDSSRLT